MKDKTQEIILDELHGEIKDDKYGDVHVDQILWKIGQIEDEIKELENKKIDSIEFYDRRIESVKKQLNYREEILNGYMNHQYQNTDKKTANLPNGILKLTTRTTRAFGEDQTLFDYSYKNNIATRVTEKPDKKAIVEHIKKTGEFPKDYEEKRQTKFSYKTTKQPIIKPRIVGEVRNAS